MAIQRRRRRAGAILAQCEGIIDIPNLVPLTVPPICVALPIIEGNIMAEFPPSGDESFAFYSLMQIDLSQIPEGVVINDFVATVHEFLKDENDAASGILNSSGFDVLFYNESGTTLLDFEILQFTQATGEVWAKIRIPSAQRGTIIQVVYGKLSTSNQSNSNGVYASRYKGFWNFEDVANPIGSVPIKDSTSNTNDGTANFVTKVAAIVADGFKYVNSSVIIPDDPSQRPGLGIWAGSVWVNLIVPLSRQELIAKQLVGSGNPGYAFRVSQTDNDAKPFVLFRKNSGDRLEVTANFVLQPNVDYLIAFNWDQNRTPQVDFLINGVPVSSTININTLTLPANFNQITSMGLGSTGTGTIPLQGTMDQPNVQNTRITPQYHSAQYNNEVAPNTFWNKFKVLQPGILYNIIDKPTGRLIKVKVS